MIKFPILEENLHKNVKLGIIAAGAIIGLVYVVVANQTHSSLLLSCPFHTITGLHCPGCGSTRAFYQILHGNILAAFDLNPLMMLALPFICYALASEILFLATKKWILPKLNIKSIWIWVILVVVILYWILRNLPWYPFCLLAP